MVKTKQGKFPQWSREFYEITGESPSKAVHCLATVGNAIWAGTDSGIAVQSRGRWRSRKGAGWPSGPVGHIVEYGREVLADDGSLHLYRDGRWRAMAEDEPKRGLKSDVDNSGRLWLVSDDGLWFRQEESWKKIRRGSGYGVGFRNFKCLPDGTAVAATNRGLFFLQGKRLYWFGVRETEEGLLSNDTRAAAPDGRGNIWVATDRGISIYSGGNGWCSLTGREKLPYEDIRTMELTPWGEYWFGTEAGLIRLRGGRWKYFASKRWLPTDDVKCILPTKEDEVWVGTPEGACRLFSRAMTLEEKARVYEENTAKYHNRMDFVTKRSLTTQGDLSSGRPNISDNDGLWTALYVAAEAFRYAVTGQEEARARARASMKALIWLESITGISGFPARAIRGKKDSGFGGGDHEWHPTPDGKWEWKGDTSSDEIDGHLFAAAAYFDFVAKGSEKKQLVDYVKRMTDHIIQNGYYLIDVHGEPTTWGVWAPERLNLDDRWRMQRGLNSLEILSHLKAAHHITGAKDYDAEYRDLAVSQHYAINTVKQRQSVMRQQVWHDDRLAYLAYYPLLIYETEPSLRQIYLLSIERTWRGIRGQRNSLWNIITSAVTGTDHDLEYATRTLAEYPLDLIHWSIKNSHRADIQIDPDRPNSSLEPLPADERPVSEWAANLHALDGGRDGMSAMDGTWYLLPYWMGRYHGLLE